ncbi:MAG: pirin family protein [Burkholderiaceae bacterium]
MSRSREIETIVAGQATQDGAGVRLTRMLGSTLQRRLDPFLMLDSFRSDVPDDYIAGFPEHPHRGFETVTFMVAGRMRHRDNRGNEGVIGPGDVQWMTAGRGILHSEMPEQEDGLLEGFQLWLNLPSGQKMCEPAYSDLSAASIPSVRPAPGVNLRLVAGRLALAGPDGETGQRGAVQRDGTEPLFVVCECEAAAEWSLPIPAGHNAFVQVYRGALQLGAGRRSSSVGQLAVLETDPSADRLEIRSEGPASAIIVAGKPLNEPIAQYGPFVMNTRAELMTAVADLQAGRFG